MARDKRIKAVFSEEHGQPSANLNKTLGLATENYCVLMDQDGELRPHSVFEAAKSIIKNPATLFIYTDEDQIDSKDTRYAPHFKSSCNPDLFYRQNYLGRLTILKTSWLKEIGCCRAGYGASQGYDLYLRFLQGVESAFIIHIPKILYHERIMADPSAMDELQSHLLDDTGVKALTDYFENINKDIKDYLTRQVKAFVLNGQSWSPLLSSP